MKKYPKLEKLIESYKEILETPDLNLTLSDWENCDKILKEAKEELEQIK